MLANPNALAVIIATLDGHNPAIRTTRNDDGTITVAATGDREPSNADYAVTEYLATLPAHHAVKELAESTRDVIDACARIIGPP